MNKVCITTVHKEIDARDPEAAYSAVKGENTYLLESSEGGEKVARYSFIGFNPVAKLSFSKKRVDFSTTEPALEEIEPVGGDPLEVLRGIMMHFDLKTPGLSRFFGGFVGYLAYDIVRYYVNLSNRAYKGHKQPSCELVLTKNNIIFDHIKGKTYLLSHEFNKRSQTVNKKEVLKGLERLSKDLSETISQKDTICQHNLSTYENRGNGVEFSSNISRERFIDNVEKAKEYIRAGDIFQVVLSRRLETEYKGDIFNVYKALKRINPSPYMYCLDLGERKIVGSSPEMLVRVENRVVETYPIAGTRPRGKTHEEDLRLEKEMLADEKERAEHVMLVDLGRNDVGRVSKFGSVRVKKFMAVEKYSHVQHMVSEVTGLLRPEMDEFDALKSVFPAGTVSGAPKVRAMEIIDELETTPRGIYAGAIGYFSFNHNIDTAISIRTIIFEKDRAYIQAGAGIVADSKPEAEFQETLNKAKALLKALKEVNGK